MSEELPMNLEQIWDVSDILRTRYRGAVAVESCN